MSNNDHKQSNSNPALWTAEECYSFLNIGRSSWYAGVAEGRFPQPIYFGPRLTRWRCDDVIALIQGGSPCAA